VSFVTFVVRLNFLSARQLDDIIVAVKRLDWLAAIAILTEKLIPQ